VGSIADISNAQKNQFDTFSQQLNNLVKTVDEKMKSLTEKTERMEIVNPVMCLLPYRIPVLLETLIRIAPIFYDGRHTEVSEMINL
jgi:hypothetical protein